LLPLNAPTLLSGCIHLRPRPCSQLQASLFSMPVPLCHTSNSKVVLWYLAFTWEAIWWRLSEFQRRQSIYSSVVGCGLHSPIAPSSNRRFARPSIRLHAFFTPLQHHRRPHRRRTLRCVCCNPVCGPLCISDLLEDLFVKGCLSLNIFMVVVKKKPQKHCTSSSVITL
jgi:hypothetical protein